MNLVLDTGILGRLCHPKADEHAALAAWLAKQLLDQARPARVFLPEIADYELRRKLQQLVKKGQASEKSIQRLDELGESLDYLPLRTATMRRAARMWAEARLAGQATAAEPALDGDVILAAQAEEVSGTVVTTNRRHLERFVPVADWKVLV